MNALEKKSELMTALAAFLRWERDGYPVYRKDQYYYDGYHDHVERVDGKFDTYTFSIQIYDSPEGDTWWEGTFRTLNGGTDIELRSESYLRT